MVHKGMHCWLCAYVLRKHMNADRNKMAAELRISDRMLERALKRDDSAEARLVYELCLRYCIDHGIDINEVFRSYFHDEE